MPMTCSDCGYYTAEQEEKCPKCNTKLQLTFLPARGASMTPPPALPKPLAPGTPSYPMPGFRGSYDLFEIILRNRFAFALVAIPLLLYGTWMIGLPAGGLQTKYQAIRMGMAADEVHRILYADSKFSSTSRVATPTRSPVRRSDR